MPGIAQEILSQVDSRNRERLADRLRGHRGANPTLTEDEMPIADYQAPWNTSGYRAPQIGMAGFAVPGAMVGPLRGMIGMPGFQVPRRAWGAF